MFIGMGKDPRTSVYRIYYLGADSYANEADYLAALSAKYGGATPQQTANNIAAAVGAGQVQPSALNVIQKATGTQPNAIQYVAPANQVVGSPNFNQVTTMSPNAFMSANQAAPTAAPPPSAISTSTSPGSSAPSKPTKQQIEAAIVANYQAQQAGIKAMSDFITKNNIDTSSWAAQPVGNANVIANVKQIGQTAAEKAYSSAYTSSLSDPNLDKNAGVVYNAQGTAMAAYNKAVQSGKSPQSAMQDAQNQMNSQIQGSYIAPPSPTGAKASPKDFLGMHDWGGGPGGVFQQGADVGVSNLLTLGMVNTAGTGTLQTGGNTLGNVFSSGYFNIPVSAVAGVFGGPAAAGAVMGTLQNIGQNLQNNKGLLTGNWSNVPIDAAVATATAGAVNLATGQPIDTGMTGISGGGGPPPASPPTVPPAPPAVPAPASPPTAPPDIPPAAPPVAPPDIPPAAPPGAPPTTPPAGGGDMVILANGTQVPVDSFVGNQALIDGSGTQVSADVAQQVLALQNTNPTLYQQILNWGKTGFSAIGGASGLTKLLGALGPIGGAVVQSNAITEAAKIQAQSAQAALAQQQAQWQQTQQNMAPWLATGQNAITTMGKLYNPISTSTTPGAVDPKLTSQLTALQKQYDTFMSNPMTVPMAQGLKSQISGLQAQIAQQSAGTTTSAANPNYIPPPTLTLPNQATFAQNIAQDPAYQFQLAQGKQAIEASQAAKGGYFSGQTGVELQDLGQGLAASNWQQYYQNATNNALQQYNAAMQGYGTGFNQLASMAGMGQTSAGQLGTMGASQATTQGNILTGLGTAQANAAIAGGNAWAQGIGGTASALQSMYGNNPQNALMQAQTNYYNTLSGATP